MQKYPDPIFLSSRLLEMNFPTVSLHFDQRVSAPDLNDKIDPDFERDRLVTRGIEQITIQGLPCGDYTICVEDDVSFMIDAFSRAKEQIRHGSDLGEHYVCLDDSRLQLGAKWKVGVANVNIETFGSTGERTSYHVIELSVASYLAAWQRVCSAILEL